MVATKPGRYFYLSIFFQKNRVAAAANWLKEEMGRLGKRSSAQVPVDNNDENGDDRLAHAPRRERRIRGSIASAKGRGGALRDSALSSKVRAWSVHAKNVLFTGSAETFVLRVEFLFSHSFFLFCLKPPHS